MLRSDRADHAFADPVRRLCVIAIAAACVCGFSSGRGLAQNAQPEVEEREIEQIRVAKPRPRMMTLENPLITDEFAQSFPRSKEMLDYRREIRDGVVNDAIKERITKVVTFRIDQMTLPTERANLSKLRNDFLNQDVRMASSKEGAPQDAREVLLEVATRRIGDILTAPEGDPLEQNFYVKLNLSILLSQLNYIEDSKNQEARAYAPAAEPMLKVLAEPAQPDLLKVAIVNGLRRIALVGVPGGRYRKQIKDLQMEIATTVLKELQRENTQWWYQMRLVETLGAVDVARDLAGRPFVVDALVRVMVDKKRHWQVRAEAAKALGRTPLANVQTQLVTWEIVSFARELADALGKDPSQPYWNGCFFNVYLAFRPLDKTEEAYFVKNSLGRRDTNLLRLSAPPNTSDALDVIKPVVRHVLANPGVPVPAGQLQAAQAYLTEKRPREFRVHPDLDPIRDINAVSTSPVADAKPAG